MAWIVATGMVVGVTVGLIASLVSPACRRSRYGRFMLREVWLPWCLVLASVLMLIEAFLYEIPQVRWRTLEPAFAEYVDEYLSIKPRRGIFIPGRRPKIRGVIVVDKSERRIATEVCSKLPLRLRARNPAQVKTVVWLEWKEVRRRAGSAGGSTCRVDCNMTVIDKTSGIRLYSKTIRGDELPGSEPGCEHEAKARPYDAIISYLWSRGRRLIARNIRTWIWKYLLPGSLRGPKAGR